MTASPIARFCSQCGRPRQPPDARFCAACGREFAATAAQAPPPPQPGVLELLPARPYPARLQLPYQREHHRAGSVFRLVLAAPCLVVWALLVALSLLSAPAGWVAALVSGRLPAPIHRLHAAMLAYATATSAYLALATDSWPPPPWTSRDGYPVSVTVPGPEPLSRLRTLVALPLALPAIVTSLLFGVVTWMLAVGAWWAILFTGRMPRTIHDMQQLAIGFQFRTLAHVPLLLTGVYPWYESGPLLLPARRAG